MPRRIVKRRFFQGLNDPAELAAEFGVSQQAMRYRLNELGLTDPTPRCARQLKNPPSDFSGYLRHAPVREQVA